MAATTRAEHADLAVADAAAPMRHHPVVQALGTLSEVADQPQLLSICAATIMAAAVTRNRRMAVCGARMLAVELLATKLKSLIKHRIDRTRPSVVADGGGYRGERGNDPASEMSSFPSGHTAGAVAVASEFGRSYPEHRIPGYAIAAAIAAIQVPRCKHYPTDLAAGAVIGLVASGTVRLAEALVRRVLRAAPVA